MYRLRKQGRFVIFEIPISKYGWVACIRIGRNLDQNIYSKFKAFALKIY